MVLRYGSVFALDRDLMTANRQLALLAVAEIPTKSELNLITRDVREIQIPQLTRCLPL